jgi:hypothetical protein
VPAEFGAVGVRGVLEFEEQAIVNPRSTATPVTETKFRDINSSRNEVRTFGLWWVMITESSDATNVN